MEEVELFRSSDEFIIGQVCGILEKNNIEFIRREDGAGAYLNIAYGSNFGLKRIFVSSEDYEKATKLIERFSEKVEEKKPEELKESEEDKKYLEDEKNKIQKVKNIMFLWIPLVMLILLIIAGVVGA